MEEIIYCDWENIMNIPFKALSDRLKNNSDECKNTKAYNNNIVSYAFLGILAKIINRFENCTEYEVGLFVRSFDKWLDRKDIVNDPENSIEVQVGDICMVDWNINYNPELSYIHPCVIIEDINNLVSVLPVSSSHYDEAYHPITNPDGNKFYRRVDISDGFQKECTIFLDGMKVISKSRITRKIGSLTCDLKDESGLYREIRWNLFNIYFPYESSILNEKIRKQNERIYTLDKTRRFQQSRADNYRNKYLKFKEENEILKKELTTMQN